MSGGSPGLSVHQKTIHVVTVAVRGDPHRHEHWLAGQSFHAHVDLDVAAAARHVLHARLSFEFFEPLLCKRPGIFALHAKLFEHGVFQIDFVRRGAFRQIKRTNRGRFRSRERTARPDQHAVVFAPMLAGNRKPTGLRAKRNLAAVGGPKRKGASAKDPIRYVHRRDFFDHRRRREIARPPKTVAEPLAHDLQRRVTVHLEWHDAAWRKNFGVLLLIQFFRTAKRTAQRLGRSVVTHRRAAARAIEVVRGLQRRFRHVVVLPIRRFCPAVRAEQILLVQQGLADGTFFQDVGHGGEGARG